MASNNNTTEQTVPVVGSASPTDQTFPGAMMDKEDSARPTADAAVSAAEDDDDSSVHPFTWPRSRKLLLVLTTSSTTFLIGVNATAIATAGEAVNERFGLSDASFPNSYWPVTAWNTGAALVPIFILPLMENFGIRYIYLTCYFLFLVFLIPQALAKNYATLIVSRFLAGAFGASVQNAVGNVAGDVYECDVDRSFAVSLFTLVYLSGFTFGPVFGGAVLSALYWRWIFYIQLIIFGVHFLVVCLLLRETREHVLLKQRAKQTKGASSMELHRLESETAPAPLKTLLYQGTVRSAYLFFSEPVLFIFTIWSGLAVGNVFLATQSISLIYSTNYGFTAPQQGLVQSSMLIGELLGGIACLWQNRLFNKSADRNKDHPGEPIIEWRLVLSIPASFIGISGGLFWYAWTSSPSLPWILPTIGMGVIGFGTVLTVQCAVTYIIDAYANNAGTAIAVLAFLENLISGFLPLAAQKMYTNLGFHWASSLIGFAALLLSFAPVVLMWKGKAIRLRSKYMCDR